MTNIINITVNIINITEKKTKPKKILSWKLLFYVSNSR